MSENGILIGIVSSLDDPEQLGRVRVKYPTLAEQESTWARLATPMGGPQRGLFLRPEVDDEVLVCFELGDPRRPYILGSLWSKADQPPPDDGKATDNNWRFFRSRSGHLLKFDDTDGAERIEIVGQGDKHKIVIDVSGSKIQVTASQGDIEISAPAGKVAISGQTVEITSTGSMKVEARSDLTVSGSTVAIN
jgi:uncharacterized protein involved in type VI secretion and phage assembly